MRLVYIFFVSTLLTGCSHDLKFDSKKWKENPDVYYYPYRESMIDDIIESKIFIGQKFKVVKDSLGQADIYEGQLWYEVTVDFGFDIDPISGKHLILTIGNDSTITNVEVREWKN